MVFVIVVAGLSHVIFSHLYTVTGRSSQCNKPEDFKYKLTANSQKRCQIHWFEAEIKIWLAACSSNCFPQIDPVAFQRQEVHSIPRCANVNALTAAAVRTWDKHESSLW